MTVLTPYLKNLQEITVFHPLHKDLIHSSTLPEPLIEELFDAPDLEAFKLFDTLVVYGVYSAGYIKMLKPWLEEKASRRLILCESRPWVYKALLANEDAETFYKTPRLHLLMTPDGQKEEDKGILSQILYTVFSSLGVEEAHFITHPMEKTFNPKVFQESIEWALCQVYIQRMYFDGTQIKSLINRFENLSYPDPLYHLESLKGAFKGRPIVLCGGGFSLPDVYETLKTIAPYVPIAAAGTANTLLMNHGVEPHFSAILDPFPNPMITAQYNVHSSMLFFLPRSGCEAVSLHHGPKILCHDFIETPLIDWMAPYFNAQKTETIGYWTVTDFLLNQLLFLGFGPIYLCGTDHILKNDQYYGDPSIKITSRPIHVRETLDIHGNKVLSKLDWIQGSKEIGQIAKNHPDQPIYYVTDHGVHIDHVNLMSIEDFKKVTFEKKERVERWTYDTLFNLPFYDIEIRKIYECIDTLITSCRKCLEIFRQIEVQIGIQFSSWQILSIDSLNPYVGIFFDLQTDLSKEIIYQKILEPTWGIFKKSIHSESGYIPEKEKYKLTLFSIKTRELDFYRSMTQAYLNTLLLQKDQLQLKEAKKANLPSQVPCKPEAQEMLQP